ncbi:HAMP domain-containing protein, partial [Streptomyces sp.]|uniref:HAMP domain-containing protein n=1 Tax=Streptomyces sp. TaxID=1931 RepID=UPI002F93773A
MSRRPGIRLRSSAVAVLVVALGLLAGAVALVVLLRADLTDDVRRTARDRADQVAAVIDAGRGVPALTVADPEEQFLQVLDADGRVVAASTNVAELPALARPGRQGEERLTTPLDEDQFLVVTVTAGERDAPLTVVSGRVLGAVAEATKIVTGLLLVGLPLLLLLAAGTTWLAVGRALAPVAAIRAEVEAISGTALHRRVPLPGGRDEIARLAATMNA